MFTIHFGVSHIYIYTYNHPLCKDFDPPEHFDPLLQELLKYHPDSELGRRTAPSAANQLKLIGESHKGCPKLESSWSLYTLLIFYDVYIFLYNMFMYYICIYNQSLWVT